MLKFDSWPPERRAVDFSEDAFDTVFKGFSNRLATNHTARSIATLLRDNCDDQTEAAAIYAELADELPEHHITDATNGVDDIMMWNPRMTFTWVGSEIFETEGAKA
jgi:hypothetical protein